MFKGRILLISLTFLFYSEVVIGQERKGTEKLFSPSVGLKFYELAYEIAHDIERESPEGQRLDSRSASANVNQGIVLLNATFLLDKRAKYVLPEMITLASQHSQQDYSVMVIQLLSTYLDKNADLEVTKDAVRYLLEKLNTREQREELLIVLYTGLGGKNEGFDSELETLLGSLKIETADIDKARQFFMQAYNSNKYNRLAFQKLVELMDEQMNPANHIEHLRLALVENPLSIEDALAFARYAEELQLYETASEAYGYCAELFKYLHPSENLPSQIYIPWAITNYYTRRNQYKCLKIAEDVRRTGRFDLVLDTVAAKAAIKSGDAEQANEILKKAEQKALMSLQSEDGGQITAINAERLAWFYCFAPIDTNNALEWANKAYSVEPNSPTAAGLLAYILAINGQIDLAQTFVDNYQLTPLLVLAKAQIELAQGRRDSAFTILKSAINDNPGSLIAEKAKQILSSNGGEYIPPVDPDLVLTLVRNNFSHNVPNFITPDKMISVGLNVQGRSFTYGRELGGSLSITNISSNQLVISDYAMFTGNIRVDAAISGDLTATIPNLVSIKVRPSMPIKAGESVIIPLRLVTSELKRILFRHPQASLDIEFTAYIDPVVTSPGKVSNKLTDIKPARITVTRPGVEITGKFLQNRVNSLSKNQKGMGRTLELFTGLLFEQDAMAGSEALYNFIYAEWMPELLKSGLLYGLSQGDWITKTQTMINMNSLPLDYDLIGAVALNLDESYWPARMMALYLLSKTKDKSSNYNDVLDWMAKYDSYFLVRDMAVALGGEKPPEKKYSPSPLEESLKEQQTPAEQAETEVDSNSN